MKKKQVRTHYDNLKIARNAPPEVIRAAYKTLSQKYHPDRNGNSEESLRIMKIINSSYEILSNPVSRRKHDEWIAKEEASNTDEESAPKNRSQPPKRPRQNPSQSSGKINFYDLNKDSREKIKRRASGAEKNQYKIKLDSVFWNYILCFALSTWFYYIYTSAIEYRWEESTLYWHAGFTAAVSLLLAKNIYRLYSWHSSPLKDSLIVTPLYLIKLHYDEISYWPIWTISNIEATHNYHNGSYQYTSLYITADGKLEIFSISPKTAFQKFINKLNDFDKTLRTAVNSNDFAYIVNNDDFLSIKKNKTTKKKEKLTSKIATFIFLPIVSFAFLGINYGINQDRPDKPAKPEYSRSKTPYNSAPKGEPSYTRPATAPNGAPWPSRASYIPNYPKLNTRGLSSVTVDNTKNDSDVFVKLVSITSNESHPVRLFFIPAFSQFKVANINEGLYDIRYRDLTTGGLARSESFTLQEISTYNGTQYSNMTMTLYKVRNGNMQTYALSESEF